MLPLQWGNNHDFNLGINYFKTRIKQDCLNATPKKSTAHSLLGLHFYSSPEAADIKNIPSGFWADALTFELWMENKT